MTPEKLLRHKNGNGRKSAESEVYEDSVIDKTSYVKGDSDVMMKSLIAEGSRINGCVIHKSKIFGASCENTIIINSTVKHSDISCEYITSSEIYRSEIGGESRIYDAFVENSDFSDLTVTGNSFIENWRKTSSDWFDGKFAYISGGTWKRPPIIYRFEDVNVTLCEAEDDQLHVNCKKYKRADWIRRANRYGKLFNLSKDQIAQCVSFTEALPKTND